MKICDCDVFKRMCLPVSKMGNDVTIQFKEMTTKVYAMNGANTCQAAALFDDELVNDFVESEIIISDTHFSMFLKALPSKGEANCAISDAQLTMTADKKTLTLPLLAVTPRPYKDPSWPVAGNLKITSAEFESYVKEMESTNTELIRFVGKDGVCTLQTHESNQVQLSLEVGEFGGDAEARITGQLILPLIAKCNDLVIEFGNGTPLTIEAHEEHGTFIGVIAPRVGD